jgi:cold shock CspA family protein
LPQGTVKTFDDGSRSGSLLLDDASEVAIDAASLEGAGVRYLRIGQRVRFDLIDESGRRVARTLRLVTL